MALRANLIPGQWREADWPRDRYDCGPVVVDDGVQSTSQRNGVSMHEPAIAAATPSLPWFARMFRRLGRISNLGNVSSSGSRQQASHAEVRLCRRR